MYKVILYQPEKPSNVGNIIRTCSAINAKLVIIGPLSFTLDDKALKRAGMDYISITDIEIYDNYKDFLKLYKDENIYYVTRYAKKVYSSCDYSDVIKNYSFMFGRESTGIPKEVLKEHLDKCIRIPMTLSSRSLNLSNCVAIVLYEALRQGNFFDLATVETIKGEDFIF